jgi:sensor c-di-GMP phosphodiesterase-like protein
VLIIAVITLLMPRRGPGNPVVEIKRALAVGEFVAYYQLVVDIRPGQLRGAEVRECWKKPDGSWYCPARSFRPRNRAG